MMKKLPFLLLVALSVACSKKSDSTAATVVAVVPEVTCLTTSYSSTNGTSKTTNTFIYNADNKIIKQIATNLSNTTTTTYQENKENLGSETKPYVTLLKDNVVQYKWYCDINGRVNKGELFIGNAPFMTEYHEYDAANRDIKITYKLQNSSGAFTGQSEIAVFEFDKDNNIIKRHSNTIDGSVLYEKTYTTNVFKNKFPLLYNFGISGYEGAESNNFIAKFSRATENYEINYSYTFDAKGYLLSSTETNTNGTKSSTGDYVYSCK